MHVHLRYAGIKEPTTGLAALEEVVAAAAATGAPLHVVHITSMGLKYTPDLIAMVEGAQRHGLDVTTECYPVHGRKHCRCNRRFSIPAGRKPWASPTKIFNGQRPGSG